MKNINEMTITDFKNIPDRKWDEDIGKFDSLVILPLRRKHDSGYRCMDFIAVKNNKPIKKLSGCSDVIHIDGIGGKGKNWINRTVIDLVKTKGWSLDCLSKSGLLRLFAQGDMTCGSALSSFEIYCD